VQTISRKDSGAVSMTININKIPLNIGYYFAGFTDGEGSFNVVFRKRNDYKMPWKVSLCFNISQRDKVVLALFKRYLNCGTLRSRKDGVWYYEVNNLNAIVENVIPFFNKFGFLSAKKKRDFLKFKEIALLIRANEHLTYSGIQKILQIRKDMNDGGVGKRKFTDENIMHEFS
jgi:hypothetical protein